MHKREHGDVTTWNTHTLTHTPHQSLHKERYTDAQIKPKVLSKEFVKKRKAGSGMHVNMLHYPARMKAEPPPQVKVKPPHKNMQRCTVYILWVYFIF